MVQQKPQTVPYDYMRHLKEEFAVLERELQDKGVDEGLRLIAERYQVPREMAVAAVHRAAKRNGYTMRVFIEQLQQQLAAEKQAAPESGPSITRSP
jgi:transposase